MQEILVGKNKESLANQIYQQIQGGADFAALAKKYSQDPGSKDMGGNFTATQGVGRAGVRQGGVRRDREDRPAPEAGQDRAVRLVRDQAARRHHAGEDDARVEGAVGDPEAAASRSSSSRWRLRGCRTSSRTTARAGRSRTRAGTRRRPTRARRSPRPTRRRPRPAFTLADALVELQELTERLRRECPWDREQTERTIVPHTVEEAYEVADAALAGDDAKLLDELGDLLFQTYFLSLLLSERGEGDLEAVARNVTAKLIERHPHVFGDAEARTAERVRENWERLKVEQEAREGVFHDVPATLPALLLARKMQRRAAAVGFDYPDVAGALADLEDELGSFAPSSRRRRSARASRRAAWPRSSATCCSRA